MSSSRQEDRTYRFDVAVVRGSKQYDGGTLNWLRPQRWSSLMSAYRARRSIDEGWDRWIDSVAQQWPVTITHKSPLLRKTNGNYAYEYGQEFAADVDAPSWEQARTYLDECLTALLTDQYTIQPPEDEVGISKIGEELSRLDGEPQEGWHGYEPLYPEIQFGASGRDEAIGIIRLDISDRQLNSIATQVDDELENGSPGLTTIQIPIYSESVSHELSEATKKIREGDEVFAGIDLTGSDTDAPTVSLAFIVSESSAQQLGESIESADKEIEDVSEIIAHPELIRAHVRRLDDLISTTRDTNGRGVVGTIPGHGGVEVDREWVREHELHNPTLKVRGFRDQLGWQKASSENEDQEDSQQSPQDRENSTDTSVEQSHYRIGLEIDTGDILAEQLRASYVDDVPTSNLSDDNEGLHLPNPEMCLFLDVALDPANKEELRHALDEIDLSDEKVEIGVAKAPIEHDSLHQELAIEVFPHFKLVELYEEIQPLIEQAEGSICTEELPYFIKYAAEEPYYIMQDVSSLTNPERRLTDEESYYNDRRIHMHDHTDLRELIGGERLALSLREVSFGGDT